MSNCSEDASRLAPTPNSGARQLNFPDSLQGFDGVLIDRELAFVTSRDFVGYHFQLHFTIHMDKVL